MPRNALFAALALALLVLASCAPGPNSLAGWPRLGPIREEGSGVVV